MELSHQELRLILECIKAHADEGWHLIGHYGFEGDCGDARELGRRVCKELGIPIEEREYLKD